MSKVKICGLKRMEDIWAANLLRPDLIGFVFAPSQRQVTEEQAAAFRRELSPGIPAVGVFVDEPVERVVSLYKKGIIQFAQLHGHEDEGYIRRLKKLCDVPVILALRVQSREQILEAEKLPADMLLLDTYVKGKQGGSGISFDWQMIPKLQKPFILAGGLNENNVEKAIAACNPWCVDVSSGVETGGYKDPAKMRAVLEKARGNGGNHREEKLFLKNPKKDEKGS